MQLLDKHEIEGSGGGGPDIYHKEGSGTPNYVDDPENEGLFREIQSTIVLAARSQTVCSQHIECLVSRVFCLE